LADHRAACVADGIDQDRRALGALYRRHFGAAVF
jgi:hypothetical protein